MSAERFDAQAYWDSLRPELQHELGTLAVALMYCLAGRDCGHYGAMTDETDVANAWFRAECKAYSRIDALLDEHAPSFAPAGQFLLPPADLTEGVCRDCGCTDERACPGGCSWAEPDLCSVCAAAATEARTIRAIQEVVAKHHGIPMTALLGRGSYRKAARPRQIAMFLAAEITGRETTVLARAFNRDRTTVAYAIETIGRAITVSPATQLLVKRLREKLPAPAEAV